MKNKEIIEPEKLRSYIKGEVEGENSAELIMWFANPEMEKELREKLFTLWEEVPLDPAVQNYDSEHLLDRIHHKIRIKETLRKKPPKEISLYKLLKLAATWFIPLTISFLIYYIYKSHIVNLNSSVEIFAPFGTRTTFYLPDGSTGMLNGGATLKFPAKFRNRVREVNLTGEAYFEVYSDRKKPFVVATREIDIKATGTSFNVKAYEDESTIDVTLRSGKVEILSRKDKTYKNIGVLKPNECFSYNSESGTSVISRVNTSDKLAWTTGKLLFKYETFDQVIRKLNRWYNVNIVLMNDELRSFTYYGTFQDESLDEVLKLLTLTAPLEYIDVDRVKNQDGTFAKRKIEIYYKKK